MTRATGTEYYGQSAFLFRFSHVLSLEGSAHLVVLGWYIDY